MAVPPPLPLSAAHLAAVAAGRAPLEPLLDALAAGHVVVVASWGSPDDTVFTLHDFVHGGVTFVPVFSSAEEARRELRGTGHEGHVVAFDARLLAGMLDAAQVVRLDAGGHAPVAFTGADLQAAVARSGRPPLADVTPERLA